MIEIPERIRNDLLDYFKVDIGELQAIKPLDKTKQSGLKTVWKRDKYICRDCGKNITEIRLERHHILPRRLCKYLGLSRKQFNDLSNLIVLCQSCHSKREDKARLFIRVNYPEIFKKIYQDLPEKINKKGWLEMADLRTKPINPDDDELIVDAPLDQWDRVLPLGLWEAVITAKPTAERSKTKHILQLVIPLELTVTDNGKRKTNFYMPLEGNGLGFTRSILDDLNIDYVHDGVSTLKIKSLKAFYGLQCKALVTENKYNGNVTNRVKRLYNKDYVPEE